MNKQLVEELYKSSDKYQGRVKELLLLATAEIQKQDLTINKLKQELLNSICPNSPK